MPPAAPAGPSPDPDAHAGCPAGSHQWEPGASAAYTMFGMSYGDDPCLDRFIRDQSQRMERRRRILLLNTENRVLQPVPGQVPTRP